MPKLKLTNAAAGRLSAPATGAMDYFDSGYAGLALRVTAKGARTWVYFGRLHGRTKRVTLGHFAPDARNGEPGSLSWARRKAGEAGEALRAGDDPTAARREKRAAMKRDSIEAVIGEWLRRDQAGNRSVGPVRRAVERNVIPRWRGRPIGSIGRRDIIELIDGIADRGAATMARRVHAYLHRMFRWSVARGIIERNPMNDLPKPGREIARERVLDDGELARVWHAAGRLGYPFGPAVRLLLLTGARLGEVGALRWSEVHGDAIRLAGERTKNGQPHTIPLAPQALAILEALPRIVGSATGRPEFAFTGSGRTAASGWSRAKRRLDALAARLGPDGHPLDEPAPLPDWRLHDLRRTMATGLQRLGHRLEVIEAALGHIGGSRAGIVGVYQRHGFDSEKRVALESWSRHVEGLAGGHTVGGNVTPLHRERA